MGGNQAAVRQRTRRMSTVLPSFKANITTNSYGFCSWFRDSDSRNILRRASMLQTVKITEMYVRRIIMLELITLNSGSIQNSLNKNRILHELKPEQKDLYLKLIPTSEVSVECDNNNMDKFDSANSNLGTISFRKKPQNSSFEVNYFI